jgi:uncharacterized protein
MSEALASAVYFGTVRHRRFFPRAYGFSYKLYLLYLDLAELDRVFTGRRFWSVGHRNLGEFRRSDYLGDPALPLDEAVRRRADAVLGRRPSGAIRLLTHLRTYGHCFNPVSFYYCYTAGGALDCIVAEITNTPWKERHSYVLDASTARREGEVLCWDFPKAFHVSPFMAMQRDYAWRFTAPGKGVHVHMDVNDAATREFDATLVLQRKPIDGSTLARCLLRYPAMTLKVVAAIHWQALRNWLRGNPVHDHPAKSTGGRAP